MAAAPPPTTQRDHARGADAGIRNQSFVVTHGHDLRRHDQRQVAHDQQLLGKPISIRETPAARNTATTLMLNYRREQRALVLVGAAS